MMEGTEGFRIVICKYFYRMFLERMCYIICYIICYKIGYIIFHLKILMSEIISYDWLIW